MARDPYSSRVAGCYERTIDPISRKLKSIGLSMCPAQPELSVLDVGCGTGTFLERYGQRGCRITGIDASAGMLSRARKRLGETAELVHGDATDMPFPDGAFDLVTFSMVIHEVAPATRRGMLREARRVLRGDGRILVIDYYPGPIKGHQGWLFRVFHLSIERLAGGEHFRNYRDFLAHGAMPGLADELDLRVEDRKVVAGGNMALCVLTKN